MKARMCKQRTGSGTHLGLEVAECNMGEGRSLMSTEFGVFSQKNSRKNSTNQKYCSLNCGNEEL